MLLALKLTLTPMLLALATWVQRRWGGTAAGLLVGLPLTSGPLSFFLALESGPSFAARAAVATLLGGLGMSGFCTAYALAALRFRAPASAGWALAACGVITLLLSFLPLHLPLAIAVVYPGLYLLVRLIGESPPDAPVPPSPAWDLPARIGLALAIILFLTSASEWLGPRWTGLLAPLPVFAFVIAIFTHRLAGGAAVHRVLRGMTVSIFGAATFFVFVALAVERLPLVTCYLIATGLAVVSVGVARAGLSRA